MWPLAPSDHIMAYSCIKSGVAAINELHVQRIRPS